MKVLIVLLSFLLCSELLLQLYNYCFSSSIFYTSSYLDNKGKPHGRDYDFHLNSMGFKDLEFTPKSDGVYRIIVAGDSFAFSSVPYRSSFLTVLEDMITAEFPGTELLNMGIPSIHPRDYLSLLGQEGLAIHMKRAGKKYTMTV